ncbi:hypothetical protein L593_03710 [Salinarchaeum sp. Harcht-Bsk1]|uniref:DUF3179 domain-containing (seleno)protein n=1 Tax=Salinarchaeum sp. Harcht-Bsk1 TaxID=1333523 RepID=UPI000342305B|nr:DUF3179 domain-containing (seleno)protein [Salinarchaeum sp. Harcht-Bsk1]AGN00693.1 hypothetical protein L593_03710 [Salinarchaeum sp. Harcht-Bsk1]
MTRTDVLPRDAIRSIDDPTFASVHHGDPTDEAFVVDGDPPRAYPTRILDGHEIVNDVHSGVADHDAVDAGSGTGGSAVPIAVTWCPICASGAVYDRRVGDRTLTFGVSGVLVDDALVMYDRETESEWRQTTGEAIAGDLEGTTLDALSVAVMPVGEFLEEHPDGEVLQPHRVQGDPAEALRTTYESKRYRGYHLADDFGLRAMRGEGTERSWDRSDFGPKTPVIGIDRGDVAVGYPLPVVEDADGVLRDSVGSESIIVVAADGRLHAFLDPGFSVERRDGGLRGDGTTWDPATGESEDGRQLERVVARHLYAFAWQDAHGPDSFYGR